MLFNRTDSGRDYTVNSICTRKKVTVITEAEVRLLCRAWKIERQGESQEEDCVLAGGGEARGFQAVTTEQSKRDFRERST